VKHKILFFIFILIFSNYPVYGAHFPGRFNKQVNDYANILKEEDKKEIIQNIKDIQDKMKVEMTLLTIKSVKDYEAGENIERLAKYVFDAWKIGGEEDSRGILVLFVLEERQIRIHTGLYHGATMDEEMRKIVDRNIEGYFKRELYSPGLKCIVANICETISQKGMVLGGKWYRKKDLIETGIWWAIVGGIVLLYGFGTVSYLKDKEKGWGYTLFQVTLGVLGTILALMFMGRGSRYGYHRRGSSGWGGGGFSGGGFSGGSSGGGFSSGGGGASGSW